MFDLYCGTLPRLESMREGLNVNTGALDLKRAHSAELKLETLNIPTPHAETAENMRDFSTCLDYFEIIMEPDEMQQKLKLLTQKLEVPVNSAEDEKNVETEPTYLLLQTGGCLFTERLDELERLYQRGIRSLTLVEKHGNALASAVLDERIQDTGLTDLGRGLIRELNYNHILLDLSGLSEKSFFEALNISKVPPYVSHIALKRRKDHPLNLTDSQLKEVVRSGGLVGFTLLNEQIEGGKKPLTAYLETLAETADLIGTSGIAIGAGFDAGQTILPDISHFAGLKGAMIGFGFYPEEADAILDGNAKKYIFGNL